MKTWPFLFLFIYLIKKIAQGKLMVWGTIKAPSRPRQSRASLGQTEAIDTVSQE